MPDEKRGVPVKTGCESSRHLYQILAANRDEVLLALNENEINPGVHYRANTLYRIYAGGKDKCPNAIKASEKKLLANSFAPGLPALTRPRCLD
jgi:dTDP-4-amino-4,6-dideoxygalactose transaminase